MHLYIIYAPLLPNDAACSYGQPLPTDALFVELVEDDMCRCWPGQSQCSLKATGPQ